MGFLDKRVGRVGYTYTILSFIFILQLFRARSSLLERLLLEPLRQLVDVEEAGAADDVLLQGVVHTLVLLLQNSGHGTRVTAHLYWSWYM